MKTIIIKIIAGMAIISAVGTAGSLYLQVWNPEWNPFEQKLSPEIVIAEMGIKMACIKSFTSDMNLEIAVEDKDMIINVKANAVGDIDNRDSENLKSSTNFNLFFSADEPDGGSLEEEEFLLTGKTISIGETAYLNLTSISISSILFQDLLAMFGISLDDFTNQWIETDGKLFEQMVGIDVVSEDYKSFAQGQEQEQEKIMEKLTEIWQAAKIFEIKEELPEQLINDKAYYHYLVALNQEELKKMIKEITGEYIEKDMEEMSAFDPFHMLPINKISEDEMQESINDFYKEMDEFFEKTGEIFAEIWIGKQDKLLYRIRLEKEIDISHFDEKEQGIVNLRMDLNLSNFDEPMNIEAPKNFKTLEEIFESLNLPVSEFLGISGIENDFLLPPISNDFPTLEFPQGFPIELE